MPQPENEKLVPLDESDFLAHSERQEQEIRKWKATAEELNTGLEIMRKEKDFWYDQATRGGGNG